MAGRFIKLRHHPTKTDDKKAARTPSVIVFSVLVLFVSLLSAELRVQFRALFEENGRLGHMQEMLKGFEIPQPNVFSTPDELFVFPNSTMNRSIVYVHVGKTGGASLDRIFRSNCEWYNLLGGNIKEECFKQIVGETRISNLVSKTYHQRRPMPKDLREFVNRESVTSFLYTIRNPLDRLVSGYNMEHINNTGQLVEWAQRKRVIFYQECFPTIEDMAMVLGRKKYANFTNYDEGPADCHILGVKATNGTGNPIEGGIHLSCNYNHYYRFTLDRHQDKEVLAIRTEHLWDDTEALNVALGGNDSEIFEKVKHHVHDHGSQERLVKSFLSKEGKMIMCCFLSRENEIFEDILKRAVNIKESEKERYLEGLYDDCGVPREVRYSGNFTWPNWSESEACSLPFNR